MPGIVERWRQLFRPQIIQFIGSDAPAQVLNLTARSLYNSQDNLAAVVNFLSNSIAQLPLKVYRRTEADERERDRNSKAAKLLWRPNNDQTGFEFIRAMATEYFVFGCVYVWVLPDPESDSGYQARIIPTDWVIQTGKANAYGPETITVKANDGNQIEINRSEFVRFCTYSPGNPGGYVSPISALRQTLEEQIQAGRFRKELWKSSGRLNAQIIRPKDVQPWSEETKKRWVEAFRESWAAGGSRAGSIPLMEDGMEIKTFNASFKEQQWVESVKLSRESVAAAYGINPSLVWHSDTQTYASSKDNARALYAECLGPILQMFQQRINSFLLPMVGAANGTYVEFDLTEKLKGSFEERASIIQASVGGPWMTRNEARRDNNLPPIDGGDELIIPLNVASGTMVIEETEETEEAEETEAASVHEIFIKASEKKQTSFDGSPDDEEIEEVKTILTKFFSRQMKSIIPKLTTSGKWWDAKRWNKELADDLEPVLNSIASKHGTKFADMVGSKFIGEMITNYIRKVAEIKAKLINADTRQKIEDVVDGIEPDADLPEAVTKEFDIRKTFEAAILAKMLSKQSANFGTREANRQAKEQRVTAKKKVYKEWVTGANARDSHSMMNGERVEIDESFSNGADWPGDDAAGADESCGCNCSTRIIIIEE